MRSDIKVLPWDDDIDVGMLRKDYDRFLDIFPKNWETNIIFRHRK